VIVAAGILIRLENRYMLSLEAKKHAVIGVAVTKVTAAPHTEELVLPGTVSAYTTAPIYARTNGYLKRWLVDLGAHVKAGQLLAEIDTPEVDQQLYQAEADLHTAQANEKLAQSTAGRWAALLKTDSVSKQEADERLGDYASKTALTASAEANLRRLRDLQSFQRIVAPFDGTVTVRNVDVGQLVSNGNGQELFHIADLSKLRIGVQVPQPYAPQMRIGLGATLHFAEHPDQQYPSKIVRTADALDARTRTLLVELEVDNAKGELFPGAYTEVHFDVPAPAGTVLVPINTLLFRGTGVFVAKPDANGRATLKLVTLGRDFGSQVEATSGLAVDEVVIVNPPDSLEDGVPIRVIEPKAGTSQIMLNPRP